MRKLSVLYSVFLEFYGSIEAEPEIPTKLFICNAMEFARDCKVITDLEFGKLFKHFQTQRPKGAKHPEFITEISCSRANGAWWFLSSQNFENGVEIRIQFLEKMVRLTTEKNI